jgi:hypothetical protein
MGHNAFLRWKAIQDAAFIDPADGKEKIWSETNVSEDFDMALRLLLRGYIIRWATYSNGGFKEGVSLTVTTFLLSCELFLTNVHFLGRRRAEPMAKIRVRMQRAALPPAHPVVAPRARHVADP